MTQENDLAQLVKSIHSSPKYQSVEISFVEKIGKSELAKRGFLKEAIKATRSKLHQVVTSFFTAPGKFQEWSQRLLNLSHNMSGSDLKDFCLAIMKCQSSTDERLPILNDFYSTIFKEIQPIHSILDLACGLNPLALPWMPVSKGCNYQAFDVLPPLIGFLNNFLQHVRQKGQASILDLSAEMPNQPADVALLLKTLPTLDQIDKQRARYLLDHCQARHLVVSYPVHSLGGKSKGMIQNYEAHFHTLTCLWEGSIQRFDFITELVFLLTRKEVN